MGSWGQYVDLCDSPSSMSPYLAAAATTFAAAFVSHSSHTGGFCKSGSLTFSGGRATGFVSISQRKNTIGGEEPRQHLDRPGQVEFIKRPEQDQDEHSQIEQDASQRERRRGCMKNVGRESDTQAEEGSEEEGGKAKRKRKERKCDEEEDDEDDEDRQGGVGRAVDNASASQSTTRTTQLGRSVLSFKPALRRAKGHCLENLCAMEEELTIDDTVLEEPVKDDPPVPSLQEAVAQEERHAHGYAGNQMHKHRGGRGPGRVTAEAGSTTCTTAMVPGKSERELSPLSVEWTAVAKRLSEQENASVSAASTAAVGAVPISDAPRLPLRRTKFNSDLKARNCLCELAVEKEQEEKTDRGSTKNEKIQTRNASMSAAVVFDSQRGIGTVRGRNAMEKCKEHGGRAQGRSRAEVRSRSPAQQQSYTAAPRPEQTHGDMWHGLQRQIATFEREPTGQRVHRTGNAQSRNAGFCRGRTNFQSAWTAGGCSEASDRISTAAFDTYTVKPPRPPAPPQRHPRPHQQQQGPGPIQKASGYRPSSDAPTPSKRDPSPKVCIQTPSMVTGELERHLRAPSAADPGATKGSPSVRVTRHATSPGSGTTSRGRAPPHAALVKAGCLHKRTFSWFPRWIRRYVVLKGAQLFYFEASNESKAINLADEVPLRVLILTSESVCEPVFGHARRFCFQVVNGPSTYDKWLLQASSLENYHSWVETIKVVIGSLRNCGMVPEQAREFANDGRRRQEKEGTVKGEGKEYPEEEQCRRQQQQQQQQQQEQQHPNQQHLHKHYRKPIHAHTKDKVKDEIAQSSPEKLGKPQTSSQSETHRHAIMSPGPTATATPPMKIRRSPNTCAHYVCEERESVVRRVERIGGRSHATDADFFLCMSPQRSKFKRDGERAAKATEEEKEREREELHWCGIERESERGRTEERQGKQEHEGHCRNMETVRGAELMKRQEEKGEKEVSHCSRMEREREIERAKEREKEEIHCRSIERERRRGRITTTTTSTGVKTTNTPTILRRKRTTTIRPRGERTSTSTSPTTAAGERATRSKTSSIRKNTTRRSDSTKKITAGEYTMTGTTSSNAAMRLVGTSSGQREMFCSVTIPLECAAPSSCAVVLFSEDEQEQRERDRLWAQGPQENQERRHSHGARMYWDRSPDWTFSECMELCIGNTSNAQNDAAGCLSGGDQRVAGTANSCTMSMASSNAVPCSFAISEACCTSSSFPSPSSPPPPPSFSSSSAAAAASSSYITTTTSSSSSSCASTSTTISPYSLPTDSPFPSSSCSSASPAFSARATKPSIPTSSMNGVIEKQSTGTVFNKSSPLPQYPYYPRAQGHRFYAHPSSPSFSRRFNAHLYIERREQRRGD